MGDAFKYAIWGIPFGCVFALFGIGLVLNFKTSGVFNLAFAAQAYASAAIFYVVRKEWEWPLVPATLVAVAVVGPVIGILLDRMLYRHQRTGSYLAKLITSLGLLVALPELVNLFVGTAGEKNPPALWTVKRTDDFYLFGGTSYALDAGQIATVVSTVVVVVALAVLFRRTALGLRMRAVVESPRLVELQGIDAERVSLISWILTSALAGLAGVLVAPLFAQLSSFDFFTLLVAAVAAAVAGNLTNIGVTFAAGIALGIVGNLLAGFLPTDSVLASGLRPSLPFLVLFGLLVFRKAARIHAEISDPLAGVSPPAPSPAATVRPPWMTNTTRILAVVAGGGGLALCWWGVIGQYWVGLITAGVCLAVIMLSMVMTTGIGGTISLSQAAFAAIGAFTTAQLVDRYQVDVLSGILAGTLVAAVAGAAVAVAVLRLGGIYPALATLAFALMFQTVLEPLDWVSGGSRVLSVPRPRLAGIDLTDDRSYLVFAAICFGLLGFGVIAVRRGTTGRYLDAVRGSEPAAQSIGINPTRPRFVAFVAGAAIAGFGGGLIASFDGHANYDARFQFFFGLVWLVLVITAGSRSVQAAIISGISFFLIPAFLDRLLNWPAHYLQSHPQTSGVWRSVLEFPEPTWSQGIAFILFGFGALTYAKHPEGIIEVQTKASIERIVRLVERRKRTGAAASPDHSTPTATLRDASA